MRKDENTRGRARSDTVMMRHGLKGDFMRAEAINRGSSNLFMMLLSAFIQIPFCVDELGVITPNIHDLPISF